MGPHHLRRGPPAERRRLRLRQGGKDAQLPAGRGNPPQAVQRGVPAADRHAAPGRGEPQPLQEPAGAAGRRHRLQRLGGADPVRQAAAAASSPNWCIRTPKKDVTDAEGRKVFKGRQTHRLPCKMYDDEAPLLRGRGPNTSAPATRCWSGRRPDPAAGGGLSADHVSKTQRQLDGGHQGGTATAGCCACRASCDDLPDERRTRPIALTSALKANSRSSTSSAGRPRDRAGRNRGAGKAAGHAASSATGSSMSCCG